MISGGVIAGRLYDRGHFYSLLWGGSLLTTFSLFMLSLAKQDHYYQVFLAQGLGAGLGGGICYVPSVAIVSHYFQRRRALAMTIVASGASLGAVIHPIMLNHTLGKLGFGTAVRASAGLVGGLLFIACCLMRTRIPVKRNAVNARKVLWTLGRDGAYIAAAFGLMIFSIGFYFPQFYLQLDATSHHLDATFSFYSLVILNFSSGLGRVIPGALANTLGVANMIVIATFASSAVIFGMIGLGSITSVVLVGIFYGFFAGSFVGLSAPLLAVLTQDFSELGIRMGVAYFFSGLGTLIGTPISGALLTSELVWWRPALFSGITAFLGSISFMVMTFLLRRRTARAAK
jgi:MFS family permease